MNKCWHIFLPGTRLCVLTRNIQEIIYANATNFCIPLPLDLFRYAFTWSFSDFVSHSTIYYFKFAYTWSEYQCREMWDSHGGAYEVRCHLTHFSAKHAFSDSFLRSFSPAPSWYDRLPLGRSHRNVLFFCPYTFILFSLHGLIGLLLWRWSRILRNADKFVQNYSLISQKTLLSICRKILMALNMKNSRPFSFTNALSHILSWDIFAPLPLAHSHGRIFFSLHPVFPTWLTYSPTAKMETLDSIETLINL